MDDQHAQDIAISLRLIQSEFPTLRDRFAMAALSGLLYLMTEQREGDLAGVAENAYYLADAMLRQREPSEATQEGGGDGS